MTHDSFLAQFCRLKFRVTNNHLSDLRRHMWVHLCVGLLLIVMLVGGGTLIFESIFGFLMRQDPFGPPLMDRLIKMVLLAFFSMLVFSNLIIMLTTTFISREVEYLMSLPLGYRSLFFAKFGETLIYSSWAFIVLAFPFFFALGQSRDLPWIFYLGAVGLVIPYLVIPGIIGAVLSLVVTAYFSPRKMIRYTIGLLLIAATVAALYHRLYGLQRYLSGPGGELGRLMRFMSVGDMLMLPSGWLGNGLLAMENFTKGQGGLSPVLFWAGALWSTALMGLVICDWLAGPLYYRGWCAARASEPRSRVRRGGLYFLFDRMLAILPRQTRAMVTKDLTVFWRDPAQWGQLTILFGLLFIYLINLRSASGLGSFSLFIPFWQSIISLFNIGATAFVLSILTTRFVYPMLSLEGKQQWVIGLGPVNRTHLVWVKFMVSCAVSTALTVPLAMLSCFMLKTDGLIYALALTNVLVMSAGLSALAVGLGALLPNFTEDNPSRIANGLGGTLNAVLSLMYVGVTLALEVPWVHAYQTGTIPDAGLGQMIFWAAAPLWIAVQAVTLALPMGLGLFHWRRIEF